MATIVDLKGENILMYRVFILLSFFISLPSLSASPAWISDDLRTSVIESPTSGAKFIGTVRSGEKVTEIERSASGEYVHIKTPTISGWVIARNIMKNPSIQQQFAEQEKKLTILSAENTQLSSENSAQKKLIATLKTELDSARENEEEAKAELVALQRASTNVVAIDQRNRELQAVVVALEQENLSLRHKNLRLSENITQKQMYAGGILVIIGFVVYWLGGFFITANRRRRTFDDF